MISDFSDYVVYVDESGDHSLTSIDEAYPVFVLAFCVFEVEAYVSQVVPALQRLKFRWFGKDTVVLHEHDILRGKPPFQMFNVRASREQFLKELSGIMNTTPMHIIPTVIDKSRLKSRYAIPENPYHLSLVFCMERMQEFLDRHNQTGRRTTIVFEQRGGKALGGKEDRELELEFRRIRDGDHYLCKKTFPDMDIEIVSKKTNSTGLQLADLVARPIGLSVARPAQENRAMDIIRKKVLGMKKFP